MKIWGQKESIEELKGEEVDLGKERCRTIADAARGLAFHRNQFGHWRQQLGESRGTMARAAMGKADEEERERLRASVSSPRNLDIFLISFWDFQMQGMQVTYRTPLHFAKQGNQVTFLVHSEMTAGASGPIEQHPNLTIRRMDIPLKLLARIPKLGRIRQLLFFGFYCMWHSTLRRRGEAKPDVVYAAECDAILIGRVVAWLLGVPLITRYYGISELLLQHPVRHALYSLSLRVPADLSVVTDDGTCGIEHLSSHNKRIGTLKFWRNGVDPPRIDRKNVDAICRLYGLAAGDCVFVVVGRLYGWKRVDRSIRLMKALDELALVNTRLLIIGQGPEALALRQLVVELDLDDRVFFVGPVRNERIYDYYALAMFVLSFVEMGNLGNPAWECLNAERCFVSVDQGGAEAVFQNGVDSILVPSDDDDEVFAERAARELAPFVTDPSRLGPLTEMIRETKRRILWTWDERLEAELSVIRELVEVRAA